VSLSKKGKIVHVFIIFSIAESGKLFWAKNKWLQSKILVMEKEASQMSVFQ
jgi:hypothetical protein